MDEWEHEYIILCRLFDKKESFVYNREQKILEPYITFASIYDSREDCEADFNSVLGDLKVTYPDFSHAEIRQLYNE